LVANVKSAEKIGALAAQTAIGQGIKNAVFDRSGSCYHGKVLALAEAARKTGLKL
jgi:large subunit ribosomal protein L18